MRRSTRWRGLGVGYIHDGVVMDKEPSPFKQFLMEKYYGVRCPDFSQTCACCVAYLIFDNTGRVPGLEQTMDAVDYLGSR